MTLRLVTVFLSISMAGCAARAPSPVPPSPPSALPPPPPTSHRDSPKSPVALAATAEIDVTAAAVTPVWFAFDLDFIDAHYVGELAFGSLTVDLE